MKHIYARRSVRRFSDEPVSEEQIESLLRAAMAAPSATNRRPWEFIVVTDAERRAALRRRLPLGGYGAPVAVAICGNTRRALPWPARDFWVQDCSAATENLLLAATGLGLGAVWIGVHPLKPLAALVSRVLELPKHIVPLNIIWVGHPAEEKTPRTQFDPERVHRDVYGS
jgi:nitroreductase